MGKGDHARSHHHRIPLTQYAERYARIDWEGQGLTVEAASRVVCMKCGADFEPEPGRGPERSMCCSAPGERVYE